jgi:hypothetical protein
VLGKLSHHLAAKSDDETGQQAAFHFFIVTLSIGNRSYPNEISLFMAGSQ